MKQCRHRSAGQVVRVHPFATQRPRQNLIDEDAIRLPTKYRDRCDHCAGCTDQPAGKSLEVFFAQKIYKIQYGKKLQPKAKADKQTRQKAALAYIAPARKSEDKQK